jgi:hypothetical protein
VQQVCHALAFIMNTELSSDIITTDTLSDAPSMPAGSPSQTARLQALCKDTNVNSETLLATDYLNHYNEIIMMLDMLASMPDMYEDIIAWKPKSYIQHFEDSGFSDKMLAIEAYGHVPPAIFKEFTSTVEELDVAVDIVIDAIGGAIDAEMPGILNEICKQQSQELMSYIDRLSSIIHGTSQACSTDGSDTDDSQAESVEQAQANVDALFD